MKLIKNILKIIFSRTVIFIMAILLQLLILLGVYIFFNEYIACFFVLFIFLGFIIVVDILNNESNPMFKLAWIIPILIFPIFGIIIYIFLNNQIIPRKINQKLQESSKETDEYLLQDKTIFDEIYKEDKHIANLVKYMNNYGKYPIYKNSNVKYYSLGDYLYPDLINDLKNAKEFIFMEYFIIAPGIFWNNILEILKDKVKNGVEVYIMYDGMCEASHLPYNYSNELKKYGINCKNFNKIVPILSTHQNNRDHRKITVIDGKIAYTGGINIADEYINKLERFGHWKDTAVKIEGDAVNSFTIMFLSMWNVSETKQVDYKKYLRNYTVKDASGYVMPYGDSPLDKNEIGKDIYLDMITSSTKYIHIMTPYLILDYEMLSSLKYAAKSGVEVIIIMPHIPDKWYAYILARSYYTELLKAGVKIYEYTNGFIHAKEFICDNKEAVVGSINLDYRSLYLHFECAAYFYKCNEIENIANDFKDILIKCENITLESHKKYSRFKKIVGKIFRLFAPLM